jgi:hypothetical protein
VAILNYPRHFLLLAGAAAVLVLGLAVHLPWSPVADRLLVLFGSSGALHAMAVVLRASDPFRARARRRGAVGAPDPGPAGERLAPEPRGAERIADARYR